MARVAFADDPASGTSSAANKDMMKWACSHKRDARLSLGASAAAVGSDRVPELAFLIDAQDGGAFRRGHIGIRAPFFDEQAICLRA